MPRRVFFRTDDVGEANEKFARLAQIFANKKCPLVGAVIPTKISGEIQKLARTYSESLEFVCHGYQHLNRAIEGSKKSEYPESRSPDEVESELELGFAFTSQAFKELFTPVFVPPWNRFDSKWVPLLTNPGFVAISAFGDETCSGKVKALNVHIDLHSSKKPRATSIDEVIQQLLCSKSEFTGIMLHHAIMNDDDFEFISRLIDSLQGEDFTTHSLRELL